MLGLLQILNYMVNRLEYSQIEIDSAFTDIVNGEETIASLLDVLGLEMSPTMIQMTQAKVSKWESAYYVIKMKQGA